MFQVFDTIGSFVRSVLAVGFAAFWGWSSTLLGEARLPDARLIGMAGLVLMIGLAGAAIAAGFYTLVLFLRKSREAPVEPSKARKAERASDFDPDAIIARYMELRGRQSVSRPYFRAADHRPLGAVRSFGRKSG